MPEGPEIRRAADRIAAAMVGKVLEDVYLGISRLGRFRDRLVGASIVRVDTRGKAMLTRFDNALTLYSHNQLYGRWYVVERGERPDTGRQLRVALHSARCSALLYSASDIAILTSAELASHPFLSRLGPDVLDSGLDWRQVARRLGEPRFRNRGLGNLYLDQGFLAGIGNYLRSEILFFAGLHPHTKVAALTVRQRNELARQTLNIAARSYRTAGLTNPPGRVRALKARHLQWPHYRHAVFRRAGKDCYVCGTTIGCIDVASRRVFFCPACQAPA